VNVVVKNGWFDRILGRPVWGEHFVFIPVGGDLGIDRVGMAYRGDEDDECVTFDLADHIIDPELIIKACGDLQYPETIYSIWTRGRIPTVFGSGIPFPDFDGTGNFIEQPFLACQLDCDGNWLAYIFICEDYTEFESRYSARLCFYINGHSTQIYKSIATDFWQLLLCEPEQIHPFSGKYYYFDGMDFEQHIIEFSSEHKFYVRIKYPD
jgi:hypothetical protein